LAVAVILVCLAALVGIFFERQRIGAFLAKLRKKPEEESKQEE